MRLPRFSLLLLFMPWSCFALYNGNPSLPMMPEQGMFIPKDDWFGVKAGYQLNAVFDRKLHVEGNRDHIRRKVQEYHAFSNLGVVTANFNDRVEAFGTLGVMSAELTHHPYPDTRVSYHTQTHFAWGAGGRAIVAYWGDLQLSVDAAYLAADLPLSSLKANGKSHAKQSATVDYREWEVGIGVSYRVRWFVPYFGVDYSDFRARVKHLTALKSLFPSKHVTFKESYKAGIFLGCGLFCERAFSLNVEGRVINEYAFSLSTDFKF